MSEPVARPPAEPPPGSAAAGPAHPHFLVQAPVPPLDADGIGVVTVGTVLFGVASAVLALLQPRLREEGHSWWLAVCVCGFGLGLVGLLYCWSRLRRRPSEPA